ncbi:stage II sporulation protein M [Polluticaenibacter yanchengensis]|uniref:Stage II sporulation protein M n=1 Tax=Polluticaenibacter yanchengensis TaxID=3014562 RepID=A0ABT4UN41_9BACT|nr:stage II sporulation protein M [Chitinophagaceae bacterium LY-5]
MREALFIKRNKEKWIKYETEPSTDPDEQSERFIALLDDLSYSKTFYPNSNVTKWINGIATETYKSIYEHRKQDFSRLRTFWTTELPLLFYKHRKLLYFTFFFFLLAIILGVLSSKTDQLFVRGILGNSYVSETENRIENGDPFGVYRSDDKFGMFLAIATNNIRVAFLAYISGLVFWMLFLSFSTLRVLMFNGVMIGAFEYMFFARDLGWQSILVIWIHGTLEIWSIVIAGMAGLVLGFGYVFPGTYSRLTSFRIAAKESVKIIVALVPFFILAAFLESYVTYQMSDTFSAAGVGLPVWLSILILAVSVLFIVFYFFYLPRKVFKKFNSYETGEKTLVVIKEYNEEIPA